MRTTKYSLQNILNLVTKNVSGNMALGLCNPDGSLINGGGGGSSTDVADFIVRTDAELVTAFTTVQSGQKIVIKPKTGGGNYQPASALIPPAVNNVIVINDGGVIERPNNDHAIKFTNAVSGWKVYRLKFSGVGKTGNYSFLYSLYTSGGMHDSTMFDSEFDTNSYHAIEGRYQNSIIAMNKFYKIDGYAFYDGYFDSAYFQGNVINNVGGGTTNNHGFILSGNALGIFIEGNIFKDNTGKCQYIFDVSYDKVDGTKYFGKISDNYCYVDTNLIYMLKFNNALSKTSIMAVTNYAFGAGANKESNIISEYAGSKFQMIEHNLTTPNPF